MIAEDETNWRYYFAVGLQASIVSFMVSSFFGSIAYSWYIYYLIAYAVCFRRILSEEREQSGKIESSQCGADRYAELQVV